MKEARKNWKRELWRWEKEWWDDELNRCEAAASKGDLAAEEEVEKRLPHVYKNARGVCECGVQMAKTGTFSHAFVSVFSKRR